MLSVLKYHVVPLRQTETDRDRETETDRQIDLSFLWVRVSELSEPYFGLSLGSFFGHQLCLYSFFVSSHIRAHILWLAYTHVHTCMKYASWCLPNKFVSCHTLTYCFSYGPCVCAFAKRRASICKIFSLCMQFTHLYYHISWLYMLSLSILPWNTPQGCSAPSSVWLHHCLYPVSNNQTYLLHDEHCMCASAEL